VGLSAITISAVNQLKAALGDLAIDMTLRTRVQNAYVPGASITYTPTDVTVKGVITKFRASEVDGTLIQQTDLLVIVFPPVGGAIPKPNDVLINGANEYRIIANNPMYAGSEIAFNLLQVRPPV
jgi:hypothetical protein